MNRKVIVQRKLEIESKKGDVAKHQRDKQREDMIIIRVKASAVTLNYTIDKLEQGDDFK